MSACTPEVHALALAIIKHSIATTKLEWARPREMGYVVGGPKPTLDETRAKFSETVRTDVPKSVERDLSTIWEHKKGFTYEPKLRELTDSALRGFTMDTIKLLNEIVNTPERARIIRERLEIATACIKYQIAQTTGWSLCETLNPK